ncbi:hypothetical protein GCM10010331_44240 [Streptomyces xanthochromogenes]|uniref:hypothetical protein n=1 Tax=Streptomyces xanthochromogenes TaxID=67384 RepID=UPI00167B26A7|nr:hypothetical protein [Streptomyces xanthochromogenes]GHB51852.1 hypothetical protein GCM10010331_44240 [Streptomyces xanthochromogenes]
MISIQDLAVEVNKPTDAVRVLLDTVLAEMGEDKTILAYGGGAADTVMLSEEAAGKIRRAVAAPGGN